MLVVAVVLAAMTGMLAVPGPPPRLRLSSLPVQGRLTPARSRAAVVVVVAATAAVGSTLLAGTQVVLALIAITSAWAVGGMLRRRRETRAAECRAGEVLALSEAMAADLAAGQPPLTVLERAAEEWPEFAPAAVAARMGADVPTVLRGLARRPGGQQLETVAATWQVAHHTGAGLAGALSRAAETMRTERRTTRLVATELAAARATARLLALLPVGVLLLGAGVGGDPVGFLTGSPVGVGILAAGLALCFLGLRWLEHIADSVLRR